MSRQEEPLGAGGEAAGTVPPREGRPRGAQGELQLRWRLTLTAQVPFPAGSSSVRSLEKMIQRGLGGGSFFLVTDDTVSARWVAF